MAGFKYEKDGSGIVTVTMDMSGPVNTMNDEYHREMDATVGRLENEDSLLGVIITSAKQTFFAGGDLNYLLSVTSADKEPFMELLTGIKQRLRRLEKLQVPVVAAINGAAMGGGFEICLACNYRIMWKNPNVIVGLPEVTLGLLPGGGGIVRSVHMLGLEKALPYLLEGKRLKPKQALEAGFVDELVDSLDDLLPHAKAWILDHQKDYLQPWDKKDHNIPGGYIDQIDLGRRIAGIAIALRRKTRGLLPAPERILSIASDATRLDFDTALRIETRGLANLTLSPQAKNIISTMFFQLNQINRGDSRPQGIPKQKVSKVGVLGAGMMGQGIAYTAARHGIDVVLKDVTLDAAERGKNYAVRLLAKEVQGGRISDDERERILERILATSEDSDLVGCDFVVEAVFEDLSVKSSAICSAEVYLSPSCIVGSNTSTLPISMVSESSLRPENFVGIHFFSPVDRMPLVELIAGNKTSDLALASAFDFARQIGKTPIVVNDSVGFFTSRTFGSYVDEGARLLQDGVDPVVIDNLGRQIGMPNGPLAIHDEISQELTRKVEAAQVALGIQSEKMVSTEVGNLLITKYGRGGRHYGGGYYSYPEKQPKYIWPELYEIFPTSDHEIPEEDIKDRLLFRPVIETLRCLDEGVLKSVADGNIGSILGIGAPTWTGGYIQFVNGYGVNRFLDRSNSLADRYGPRFSPPSILIEKSATNGIFS